jgi:hypothetical protein
LSPCDQTDYTTSGLQNKVNHRAVTHTDNKCKEKLFIHHSGHDHPDIRPLKMSHDAALPPRTSFHGGKSSTFSSRGLISDGAHALHFVASQFLLAFFMNGD